MWIQTQNKQQIINSDHIINIFVARTAPIIYANTTDDADYIILGEYPDKDTCLGVLNALLSILSSGEHTMCMMPLCGMAIDWSKKFA